MKKGLSLLLERSPVLTACEKELGAAFDLLVAAYQTGNKLLICGNGGSAADSEHMVAELMKGFLKRRPIPAAHGPPWAHTAGSGRRAPRTFPSQKITGQLGSVGRQMLGATWAST